MAEQASARKKCTCNESTSIGPCPVHTKASNEANGESPGAEQSESPGAYAGPRLDPARLRPAEHVFRMWHVTVPAGTPRECVLAPEFWSGCAQRFTSPSIDQPPDWIFCRPPDGSWFAWLIVVSVGAEGVEVAPLGGAELPHRRVFGRPQGALGTNVDDFEFQDLGPGEGWAVVRRHDQHVMHKCGVQSQCMPWLSGYLKSVRT